jgi:hypothetical protein
VQLRSRFRQRDDTKLSAARFIRAYHPHSVEPTPDDLVAATDRCVEALTGLTALDWTKQAAGTDWTCRETLEHVCSLAFVHQLATRAPDFHPIAIEVRPATAINELVWTVHVLMRVLAEVARAAPPDARAFHPAGMADASGWVAMGMDELLIHTGDITDSLGVPFAAPAGLARVVLDRLFPWWPRETEPWLALRWANGRGALPDHPNPGASWLWHCAPLDEWDGTIPEWDQVANRPRPHH